jgi:hypothetical protein
MKIIGAAYFALLFISMGSATALVGAEALFCTQKNSPAWCMQIDKITDAFMGY